MSRRLVRWTLQRRRALLAAIILCAAVVRLVYLAQLAWGPGMELHAWPQGDAYHYVRWAHDIRGGDALGRTVSVPLNIAAVAVAEGHMAEQPDPELATRHPGQDVGARYARARAWWDRVSAPGRFYQDPLYAYLLALLPDPAHVVFLQLLAGLATAVLTHAIARAAFGTLAGLVAAALAAFLAPAVHLEPLILREPLLGLLQAAWTLLLLRTLQRPGMSRCLFSGVITGVFALYKSTFVMLLPVALAAAVARSPRRPVATVAVLAGTALGLAPLWMRNVYLGLPALGSASSGAYILAVSNTADATPYAWGFRGVGAILQHQAEGMLSLLRHAWAQHPDVASVLALYVGKLAAVFHAHESPDNASLAQYASHAPVLGWLPSTWWLVAPLACAALLSRRTWGRRAWPLIMVVLLNGAVLMGVYVAGRLRLPLAWSCIPLAAYAATRLVNATLTRQRGWLPAAGVLVVLLVAMARPLDASVPRIRRADYGAPYEYFYRPRIMAALEAGDTAGAARWLGEHLVHAPQETGRDGTRTSREAAAWYAPLHEEHAALLERLGDVEGARSARTEASRLRAFLQAP